MIFKTRVNQALRVLQLMRKTDDRRTKASMIEDLGFSESYADHILGVLSNTGLVDSERGPNGGYVLTKDKGGYAYQSITITQLMRNFYPDDKLIPSLLSEHVSDMVLDDVLCEI